MSSSPPSTRRPLPAASLPARATARTANTKTERAVACHSERSEEPKASVTRDEQEMIVVRSGPSASGKDAVADRILSEHADRISPAITATTRPPRPGEVDAVHYRFLTPDAFAELEESGQLLESAIVYGYRYGVPRESVRAALDRTPIALVKTDVQGAASIKALIPQALLLFITVPDFATLERRMRTRGGMDQETMERRLQEARNEIERRDEFDYVVVNEDGRLDEAVTETWEIIEQEAARPERRPVGL
ncbi:MAG: guanylate kinase [Dehalococcoidia bacterium]|nr:guanylate kinase [Dehalococcoidia bacterium]